jgi:hypothetical protein
MRTDLQKEGTGRPTRWRWADTAACARCGFPLGAGAGGSPWRY